MRVAAGCREYNVEGRLELGTGNTQTHTKQGSSTAPLSLIILLLQNGCWDFYHFINKLEKEAKRGKIKEKEGWANIGLSIPTPLSLAKRHRNAYEFKSIFLQMDVIFLVYLALQKCDLVWTALGSGAGVAVVMRYWRGGETGAESHNIL